MFHISNDKRAEDSATQLRDALCELLRTDSLDRITISQLCARAQVSRTTFYRLFDTTTDILHWYCDVQSRQLCAAFLATGLSPSELFRFNVRYIFDHPESLDMAYRAGRLDIADAAFHRNIASLLFEAQRRHGLSENDIHLSGVVVSAIITSAYVAWAESGKRDTPEQLYARLMHIIRHIQ